MCIISLLYHVYHKNKILTTLLIKKDGEVVNKVVGYHAKEQLEELLAQYL